MKPSLILLVLVFQISCNNRILPSGQYYNTKYLIDAPINILSIEQDQRFSLIYPNVIGEKVLGVWEIKNDTLLLHVKSELTNSFQDTLVKYDNLTYKYLIKGKGLYSTNNKLVLKRT
jgi:hypothetical protein